MDTSIYQILSYQQNENKELGILKAIYLSAIDDITSKIIELGLEPKHFYSPTYAKLYEKAVDLALDEKSVAPQDLPDELLSAFNFEDVDPLNYQQDVVDVIAAGAERRPVTQRATHVEQHGVRHRNEEEPDRRRGAEDAVGQR